MLEFIGTVIIIPITVGVIRMLFTSELQYLIALIYTYFWRPFDVDNNGKTHDWCALHSGASGNWSYVSLLYKFNPFDGSSGVHIHRYNENWDCIHVERVRFADWAKMRKAVITTIPDSLQHKLDKNNKKDVAYDVHEYDI